MWFDGNNTFINLDHVDYIIFENQEKAKATVNFNNGDFLTFEANSIDELKNFFKKVFDNGRASEEMGH